MSSLPFLTYAQQAALHRETYAHALKGMLPFGTAKDFAQSVLGITPVYLSNLLDPDHNPPSPELAERIASALPVDREQQLSLLEHMLLAREASSQVEMVLRRQQPDAGAMREAHTQLRDLYGQTILTRTGAGATTPILTLHDAGKTLLTHLSPRLLPLVFVETVLIVHAAQCALNRWIDALYLTRVADTVLHNVAVDDVQQDWEWMQHLRINVWYAAAITYRDLNQPRLALDYVDRAAHELHRATQVNQSFWLPYLYREKLEIMARLPRFALADAQSAADHLWALIDKQGSSAAFVMLIDRALINALVNYGSSRSLKTAGQRIRRWLDSPLIGSPLQQVMFWRACARYFWRSGQRDTWRQVMTLLLDTATRFDLTHQLRAVQREYGSALDSFNV
ncbi:MAG: hypothetical protein IAE80_04825 [Anaerolinea sp.]|nr:hypothetical protein [Anaerolinea sp.]